MRVNKHPNFVEAVLPIHIHNQTQAPTVIGVAFRNRDQSYTILCNQSYPTPEMFRLRAADGALELSTHISEFSTNIDEMESLRSMLHLLSPTNAGNSSRSRLTHLIQQTKNRVRLLREALLSSKDWKTRLILQYELEIVRHHCSMLERKNPICLKCDMPHLPDE